MDAGTEDQHPTDTSILAATLNRILPPEGSLLPENVFAKQIAELDAPNNIICKTLRTMPALRNHITMKRMRADWIPNITRIGNIEAFLAALVGEVAPTPCDHCARGSGAMSACFIVKQLDGTLFLCGSCASCHYNAQGSRCSFRSDSPNHLYRRKATSVSPSSARKDVSAPSTGVPKAKRRKLNMQQMNAIIQSSPRPVSSLTGVQKSRATSLSRRMGPEFSNLEKWARSLSAKEKLGEMTMQMEAFASVADALTKRKEIDRASGGPESTGSVVEMAMWRDIAGRARTFAAVANAHADSMDGENLEREDGGEDGEGKIANWVEGMDHKRVDGDESPGESESGTDAAWRE